MRESKPRVPGTPKRKKPRPYGGEAWVVRDDRTFDVVGSRPGTYWRRRLPGAK